MRTTNVAPRPVTAGADGVETLLRQYGRRPVEFTGTHDALYDRHLLFDNVIKLAAAGPRERFEAFARSVRDVLSQRWVLTEDTYAREDPKRVYYLSMEFLIFKVCTNRRINPPRGRARDNEREVSNNDARCTIPSSTSLGTGC